MLCLSQVLSSREEWTLSDLILHSEHPCPCKNVASQDFPRKTYRFTYYWRMKCTHLPVTEEPKPNSDTRHRKRMDKASTHHKIINSDYKAWNKTSDNIPKSIQDLTHQVFESKSFWRSDSLHKKALAPYAERKNTDICSMWLEKSVILQSHHPQQVSTTPVLPKKLTIILTHSSENLFQFWGMLGEPGTKKLDFL